MSSLDGIAELHMSGSRAVFTCERGERVSEMDVALAFEQVGMKLESYGTERRPRAQRHTAF